LRHTINQTGDKVVLEKWCQSNHANSE
jgi:hypothetical protein